MTSNARLAKRACGASFDAPDASVRLIGRSPATTIVLACTQSHSGKRSRAIPAATNVIPRPESAGRSEKIARSVTLPGVRLVTARRSAVSDVVQGWLVGLETLRRERKGLLVHEGCDVRKMVSGIEARFLRNADNLRSEKPDPEDRDQRERELRETVSPRPANVAPPRGESRLRQEPGVRARDAGPRPRAEAVPYCLADVARRRQWLRAQAVRLPTPRATVRP